MALFGHELANKTDESHSSFVFWYCAGPISLLKKLCGPREWMVYQRPDVSTISNRWSWILVLLIRTKPTPRLMPFNFLHCWNQHNPGMNRSTDELLVWSISECFRSQRLINRVMLLMNKLIPLNNRNICKPFKNNSIPLILSNTIKKTFWCF